MKAFAVLSLLFTLVTSSLYQKTPLEDHDVIAHLDNKAVLYYAKLCEVVYQLPNHESNKAVTSTLRSKQLIDEKDKVIIQGVRHKEQLSSIMVKRQEDNHFTAIFVGTKSGRDALSDALALPDYENLGKYVEEAFLRSMPTRLRTWIQKIFRINGKQDDEHVVALHMGFEKAGKDFNDKLFENIKLHYIPGQPIHIDLTGHSMGGALAAQSAYHIKDRLYKVLDIPNDMVHVKIVLFAAAGSFKIPYLDKVCDVIGADQRMVTFYRPSDFARELTKFAGYANPGHDIELDDFVASQINVLKFMKQTAELKERPSDIWKEFKDVDENHSITNYVRTIEEGIDGKLEEAKENDSEFHQQHEEEESEVNFNRMQPRPSYCFLW
jgi:hypothetical protein